MDEHIMTVVSAVVPQDREADLVAAFEDLLHQPLPDGLLQTQLLRGAEGRWRVESLWRDRAALEAMRAATDAPAAPALFRGVGAQPTLAVFEVVAEGAAV
ncbi:MAG TPA: antibiotic biosynthesis monooxygenase [Terrabacter sp.]|nr:antibiotic biosynthesis monooxygenase [Terrabacter sp.]